MKTNSRSQFVITNKGDGKTEFDPPPHVPCYEVCRTEEAEVATNLDGHSIQVIGQVCEFPHGSTECETESHAPTKGVYTRPPLEGPQEPCTKGIIKFSAEQFRESGTYIRAVECPNSLDVEFAHDRAGNLLVAFGRFLNWNYYKKTN